MLFVCMISGPSVGSGQPIGVPFPREHHFSHPGCIQLPSVLCEGLQPCGLVPTTPTCLLVSALLNSQMRDHAAKTL